MDDDHTATPTFWFSSWFPSPIDSPTMFPYMTLPTIPNSSNFTVSPLSTSPENFTMQLTFAPPITEPNPFFLTVSLAVRVVLFATCYIENSIALYILHKNLKNGRKTFTGYILISMACADVLGAILYYPAEFVRFSESQFVWLVQGRTGDVLCKLYSFLVQIPGKVLILCLVALACDVTRNLSSKGRREHTRQFSAVTVIFFWIFAAGQASMHIVISEVSRQMKMCTVDPAKQQTALMLDLLHRFMFVMPANFILAILNLVIYCQIKRRKKEMTRKAEIGRAERMKERQQMTRMEDTQNAKAQELTEEGQEMLSSKSCEAGGERFTVKTSQQNHTSRKPFETKNIRRRSKGSSDADEDDPSSIAQTALEQSFQITQEEAKVEGVTATLFIALTVIMLIVPFVCKDPDVCSAYVFFAVQVALDIYGVIKPGIYAYTDKEFRKRYKQLSPFACCCFRRIQCHTAREQVGTRNSLPYKETSV